MNRINYGAVVVSAVVYWVIQAIWYTVFADAWIAAIGVSPEQVAAAKAHPSPVPYITAFLANAVIAYVISLVLIRTGAATPKRGLLVAFVMWMGFVATTLATQNSFALRPPSLLAINGGSTLLGMLATGLIVGAWRAKAAAA